jgi:hypothetical protein
MASLLAGLAAWLIVGTRRRAGRPATKLGRARALTDREGTSYQYAVPMGRGVALSVLVGFVSSFLGIGGGVLHVPLLIGALGIPVHVATATSHFVLANMAAVGTATHILAGNFSAGTGVHRAIALSIGVVAGAQLGALLSKRVHGLVIQRLLAVALVAIAVRLLVAVL